MPSTPHDSVSDASQPAEQRPCTHVTPVPMGRMLPAWSKTSMGVLTAGHSYQLEYSQASPTSLVTCSSSFSGSLTLNLATQRLDVTPSGLTCSLSSAGKSVHSS